MILIKPRTFWIAVVVVLVGIGVLGVLGYLSLLEAADAAGVEAAHSAERYLFVAIVVLISTVVMLGILWATGGRVIRLLDRIQELARLRGVPPENRLFRLGALGGRIMALLSTTSEISARRATKISGLSKLAAFLTENVDAALAVTDANGVVRYATDRFAEKNDRRRAEIIGLSIDALFPAVRPMEVLTELGRYRGYRQIEPEQKLIDVYAIFDDDRRIVYVVYSPDRDVTFSGKPDFQGATDQTKPEKSSLSRRFRGLFDRSTPREAGNRARSTKS